jgi:hypothetical protein
VPSVIDGESLKELELALPNADPKPGMVIQCLMAPGERLGRSEPTGRAPAPPGRVPPVRWRTARGPAGRRRTGD